MKRFLVAAGAATLVVTVTACGSSETTTDTAPKPASSSPASTASAMPSDDQMVGTDPGTWAPIPISMNMNGAVLQLEPGQAAVFVDLPADDATNNYVVESDAPDIVQPMQSSDDGTVQMGAGFTAVAPGSANVTVLDGFPADGPAEVVMQLTVQVVAPGDTAPLIEEPMGVEDMSSLVPIEITPDMTGATVDMSVGQSAILLDLPMDTTYTVTGGFEVIDLSSIGAGDPVVVNAIAPGSATLTATDAAGATLLTVVFNVSDASGQ